MQVKELAVRLQEELAKAQANDQKLDGYIALESQYALKELQALIDNNLENKAEFDTNTAQPFKEFLEIRWQRIQGTDAIYSHNPDSLANQICLFLAEQMSSVMLESKYGLAMPTLEFTVAAKLTDEQLNQVVLADDNKRIIDIQSCLEIYRSDRSYQSDPVLRYTDQRYGGGDKLSSREETRVKEHDSATYNYFIRVKGGKARLADDDRYRVAFVQNTAIGSSYGEEGKAQLASKMHALYQFDNGINLIRHIANTAPELRQQYFDGFEKGSLKDLLLEDKTLVETLKLNPDFDDSMSKAWLDCLVEHYWKERSGKGSYTSLPGMAFGLVGLAYSKDDKEPAVSELQSLLRSDKPLSEIQEAINLSERKGAIMDGALGLIAKKAIELGKPEVEEELQPTGSTLGM